MDEQHALDREFAIVELEPREAPAPDATFWGSGGSGGHGSGGSGGGSGT